MFNLCNFSYMTKSTGRLIENYNDIKQVYTTLKIEELNNYTLPNWTKCVYPDKMRELACYR